MASIEPLTTIEAYRRVLVATLNTLEEVLSSDDDMPSDAQTLADADQWLDAVRAELK
jgi:hypothetical protein